MKYTIERITKSNYNKFENMVFYRENGFQREPSNAPVSQQMTEQLNKSVDEICVEMRCIK